MSKYRRSSKFLAAERERLAESYEAETNALVQVQTYIEEVNDHVLDELEKELSDLNKKLILIKKAKEYEKAIKARVKILEPTVKKLKDLRFSQLTKEEQVVEAPLENQKPSLENNNSKEDKFKEDFK